MANVLTSRAPTSIGPTLGGALTAVDNLRRLAYGSAKITGITVTYEQRAGGQHDCWVARAELAD